MVEVVGAEADVTGAGVVVLVEPIVSADSTGPHPAMRRPIMARRWRSLLTAHLPTAGEPTNYRR
jgi:hypothetical protein